MSPFSRDILIKINLHFNQETMHPNKDYTPYPDLHEVYTKMAEKCHKDREMIEKRVRQQIIQRDNEQKVRESWHGLGEKEKQKKAKQLQRLCNELIRIHPDYKGFKTANISIREGSCSIHWNGHKLDEATGWGALDREFPEHDIPLVIKRYYNKLRHHQNEEEI